MGLFTLSFPLWLFLIPFSLILFWNVNICNKDEWQSDSLGLSHSKDLLGFFALMIVVHHMIQQLIQVRESNVGIMVVYENIGVCFVGGFFFFSGYGLIRSINSKPNYLDNFFKKRLSKILIPFYVVNTFFVIITYNMKMIGKDELFDCITGIVMPNDHMWYLVEMVLLYTLFYFNFKNAKSEEAAFLSMFAQIITIIVLSVLIGHGEHWFQGEWWYNSTILFFVGMLIARFETKVITFAKNNYKSLLTVVAAAFLVLHILTVNILNTRGYWTEYADLTWGESTLDKFQALFVQMPMIICFVLLVLLIGLKVKVNNKVLSFLGTISLDLYITHRLCIWVFEWIKSDAMYMLTVLICSIILGSIFYVINSKALKIVPVLIDRLILLLEKALLILQKTIKIKKYSTWGLIFIAPFMLFYMVFSFIPLMSTIVNSFFENYRSGLMQVGPKFVGLANYQKLFANGDFWKYLGNTMLLWILCFIPQIILSLLLAAWFSDRSIKIKGDRFFKTIIYLPSVIMATALAALFASLFSLVGPINDVMVDTLKIWPERISFFSGIATTRGLIVFMNFLMSFGSSTLILMAGMMNIDTSIFEAARVDGAKPVTIFSKITMPMIKPIFIYVVITSLISGTQLYDVPAILTEGSGDPVRSSFTMVMYLNNNLFSKNYGMSGAISTLMLLVTGTLSIIILFINRRNKYEDS